MRQINKIIIHCSDSDIPAHDNIETIRKWHVEERGWSDVGYHFFIRKDGRLEKGRDIETIGAHCKGHNKDSIGICLSGRHDFTIDQFVELGRLWEALCATYATITDIKPHNYYDSGKTCPNFSLEIFN